jgi:lactoylglutathione lyase
MHMNHVNLPVPDVAASADFMRDFFEATDLGPRQTTAMALLTDGYGTVINISNFNRVNEVAYPGAFHIGFACGSREEVDAVHRRLTEAGHSAAAPRSPTAVASAVCVSACPAAKARNICQRLPPPPRLRSNARSASLAERCSRMPSGMDLGCGAMPSRWRQLRQKGS